MAKNSRFGLVQFPRLPRWHRILCGLLAGLLALVALFSTSPLGSVAYAADPGPTGNGLGVES